MATGLKYSVQVSAYIDPQIKRRMDEIVKRNRRDNISAQVEEALKAWLPSKEQELSFDVAVQRATRKKAS